MVFLLLEPVLLRVSDYLPDFFHQSSILFAIARRAIKFGREADKEAVQNRCIKTFKIISSHRAKYKSESTAQVVTQKIADILLCNVM